MTLPVCIGFIMDGNRRWAKANHLATIEGHKQGADVLAASIRFVRDRGIRHAVYYAFSTENWKRAPDEVAGLMSIFKESIATLRRLASEETPVRIRFIGTRSDFDAELQTAMNELEAESAESTHHTTIWVALSYGGRAEIVAAANAAVAQGHAVTEGTFESLLWTAELPDPDIIVRTSGEERLSNFLTWRAAYSELYFIEKPWPALTAEDFEDILSEYATRSRRHGA